MVPYRDARRRINVTFPESLLDLMEDLVPARERNAFIVAATEKALQQARLEHALRQLAEGPAWSDADHPELATDEDIDRYVRTLRESWLPRSWDSIAGEDETHDSPSAGQ
jgi:hypothetical protein